MKNWIVLLIALCIFSSTFSQKPGDFSYLDEKYPDKDYIFLEDHTTVFISLDKNNEPVIKKEVETMIYLPTDRAALFKKDKVYSSYFEEIEDIEAYALNRKNEKSFKKKKVKDFDFKKTISKSVFHDDVSVTEFEYNNLKKGSITYVKYTKNIKVPQLSTSLFLASSAPMLHKSLTIEFDNAFELGISEFNMDTTEVQFSKEEGRKKTVYKWEKNDIEPMKRESKSPNIKYFAPHIIVRIKSYTIDGEMVPVLRDPSDLFTWYKELTNETKCENDLDLRKVLDEIITDEQSEEEKIKTVFYWVQDNIKYIAIEDGLGGLIPRNPDLVFSRRYGDCKDMATLIVEMLTLLDIKAYQVWIGSRDIPYTYAEMPSPVVDNHMIAAVYDEKNNEYIFLDATDNQLAFGLPTAFIQGKEALIHLGDTYAIEEVPVISREMNDLYFITNMYIEGTTVKGTGELNARGFYANDFNHGHNNIKNTEGEKKFVKRITQIGSNKYKLLDYDIFRTRDSIHYNYTFEIDNYIYIAEDEMYINMNMDEYISFFDAYEKDRKLPVEERFTSSTYNIFELNIPTGYRVDYIPENLIEKGNDYLISVIYDQIDEDKIRYTLAIELDYLIMNAEDAQSFNEVGKRLKRAFKEQVVLVKK